MLSVARIAAYLGGITGQDAYLAELEAAAVADVQTHSGRWLGPPTAFVDVRDGIDPFRHVVARRPEIAPRPQSIRLAQPVAAVSAIVVSERFSPRFPWVVIDHASPAPDSLPVFELQGHRLLRNIGLWPVGARTVMAAYTFGYSVDAAPPAFCGVVLDLIAIRYQPPKLRGVPMRVTGVNVRGAGMTLASPGAGGQASPAGIPAELMARIHSLREAGSF